MARLAALGLALVLAAALVQPGQSRTKIYDEGFGGQVGYGAFPTYTRNAGGWSVYCPSIRYNYRDFFGVFWVRLGYQRFQAFVGKDLDGTCTWTSPVIRSSCPLSNGLLQTVVDETGSHDRGQDFLRFEVQTNGGPWRRVYELQGEWSIRAFNHAISGTFNTIRVRFLMRNTGDDEFLFVDVVRLFADRRKINVPYTYGRWSGWSSNCYSARRTRTRTCNAKCGAVCTGLLPTVQTRYVACGRFPFCGRYGFPACPAPPEPTRPPGFGGYVNTFNNRLNFNCPSNNIVTGAFSYFDDRSDDRRWAYKCAPTVQPVRSVALSGFINGFNSAFSYTCPGSGFISGFFSDHSNTFDDRRWRIRCSQINNNGAFRTACRTESYSHGDKRLLSFATSGNRAVAGFKASTISSGDDRRFQFVTCEIRCSSPWQRSGLLCVCPRGNFRSGSSCRPIRTSCPRGTFTARAGTATSDRVCTRCRAGTFQASNAFTGTSCSLCRPGTISAAGASACSTCPSSGWQNLWGQAACKACSSGFFRSSSTRQSECTPGSFCSGCVRRSCPAGSISTARRATRCTACSSTTFQDRAGQTSCKTCSPGSYRASASAQASCPAGFRCPSRCGRWACGWNQYQDRTGQTTCKAATTCGAGQRVTRRASRTLNTRCGACPANTFQASTRHLSTSCAAVRVCAAGQQQSRAPTASTDRTCATCPAGTFQSAASATAPCRPWSVCPAGSSQSRSPSSTRDRKCQACRAGSYGSRGFCFDVSGVCPPGSRQTAAPTRTSDRVCVGCVRGSTYQDRAGQSTCKAVAAVCRAGQFQRVSPAADRNRICWWCNGRTQYQDRTGQTGCKAVTTCSRAQFESSKPTRSTDRVCTACRTQAQCAANEVISGTCGGSTGQEDRVCQKCHHTCARCSGPRDTQCTACNTAVGFVLQSARCVILDCPVRQYKTATGCRACHSSCFECEGPAATQCLQCSGSRFLSGKTCVTACPARTFQARQYNDNECRACATCSYGKFSSTNCGARSNTVCRAWTACLPGQKQTRAPTADLDRQCAACAVPAEFQPRGGQRGCIPTTPCEPGEFVAKAPTALADRACRACAAGSFSTAQNTAACLPCPAGRFQARTGQAACSDCGRGRFQPAQGASRCLTIEPGFFGSGGSPNTRQKAVLCPAGSSCAGGAAAAAACPSAEFQDEKGQARCKPKRFCRAGQLASRPGSTTANRVCAACPAGQFQSLARHTATACRRHSACPAFQIQLVAPTRSSDRTCGPCPSGTFFLGGACRAWTACASGQEEAAPGTPTSDRVCQACEAGNTWRSAAPAMPRCVAVTGCTPGQFELRAPTTSSDRVCARCNGVSQFQDEAGQAACKRVAPCSEGERQTAGPTRSTDRACGACPANTFQDAVSHTAAACKPLTVCAPGRFEATPPDAERTANRACGVCVLDQTFSAVANAPACSPVTKCGAGQLETADATLSANRQCAPCPANTFQALASHARTSCTPVRTCRAGTFRATAATPSSDAVCTPCPTGQFQAGSNAASCTPHTTCAAATEFEVAPPSRTADRQCRACRAASSCAAGLYLSGVCGGAGGIENPACAMCDATCGGCVGPEANQCTGCAIGFVLRDGRCVSNCAGNQFPSGARGCGACDASCTTCSAAGSAGCTSCSGSLALHNGRCVAACPAAFFARPAPTGSGNLCEPCTACAGETYQFSPCGAAADAVCLPVEPCRAGEQQAQAPTATSNRICEPCPAETFQDAAGETVCTPATQCAAGEAVAQALTPTSDRVCAACAAGSFSNLTDAPACTACPPGFFGDVLGAAACRACSQGTYQPEAGQTACRIVSPGHFALSPTDGAEKPFVNQAPCTAGTACPGNGVLVLCDGPDEFQDADLATECKAATPCTFGEFEQANLTSTADRVCAACPAGSFVPLFEHTERACTPFSDCAPGSFQASAASSRMDRVCTPCQAGAFQPRANQPRCDPLTACAAGFEQRTAPTASSDRACRQCAAGATFQNLAGGAPCKPVTVCAVGEREAMAPSILEDRECAPCNGLSEFQDEAGRAACKRVRLCPAGQREAAAPTPSTDRRCGACPAGSFQASAAYDSDVCAPLTACAPGEFVVQAPTPSSDRVCAPCELGAAFSTATNAAACTPTTRCGAGQFVSAAATAAADRTCGPCEAGRFNPKAAHVLTACLPVSECAAGSRQTAAPTASSDRVCAACPAGQFQDAAGQAACRAFSVCAAGEFEAAAGTPTSDRRCEACTAASECQLNEFLDGQCGGTSNPACRVCHSTCEACTGAGAGRCTACPAGDAISKASPADAFGRCVTNCPNGMFRDGSGTCAACDGSCFACLGAGATDCTQCAATSAGVDLFLTAGQCAGRCPAGSFKVRAQSDNTCQACTVCGAGFFARTACSEFANTMCAAVTVCAAGQFESAAPTPSSDAACAACPANTFSAARGQAACQPATVCAAGERETTPATASSDRACTACAAGSAQPAEAQAACTPCGPGTFADVAGLAQCRDCGLGRFAAGPGATGCQTVPAGRFGSGGATPTTNTGTQPCPAGSMCPGGAAERISCNGVTEFQDRAAQTACKAVTACDEGERASAAPTPSSDRACAGCAAGTFQDDSAHDDDVCDAHFACPVGQQEQQAPTATSDRTCVMCNGATLFADEAGQAACKPVTVCAAGRFQTRAPSPSMDRLCAACALGDSFSDQAGATACNPATRCGAGTRQLAAATLTSDRTCQACNGVTEFQDVAGQTACKPVTRCRAGEFEAEQPTATSDRACAACAAETFTPEDGHALRFCFAVKVCDAGTAEGQPPTPSTDRECVPCAQGTSFADAPGAARCTPVTACGPGERELSAPTGASDRVCGPCGPGTFQDLASHAERSCKALTRCLAGAREAVAPTPSTDRRCAVCDGVDEFQPANDQLSCDATTVCAVGSEFEISPPTPIADRRCANCTAEADCSPHEFLAGACGGADGKQSTRCAACHPTCATCDGPAVDQCLTCPLDFTFQAVAAPSRRRAVFREGRCLNSCPAGEFAPDGAGATCMPCDATCADCDGPSAQQCVACPGGRFLDPRNQCVQTCPAGTFADGAVCKACAVCQGEFFSSTPCAATADTVCSPWSTCPVGEQETVPGSATANRVCAACDGVTEFQDLPGQVFCHPVTQCVFPDIEAQAPTARSDRFCFCDRVHCSNRFEQAYARLVCAEPSAADISAATDRCCDGETPAELEQAVRALPEFAARETCPGCRVGTCACEEGFELMEDASQADVCLACAAGVQFNPNDGDTCQDVQDCRSGEQQRTAPTASTDRVCEPCPAGTIDHDLDWRTPCVRCPRGAFVPRGSEGQCAAFVCPAGTADADADPATACEACVSGATYQSARNQTQCLSVRECQAGEAELIPPIEVHDRVCLACPVGVSFKDVVGQTVGCSPVTECAAGEQELQTPTPSSDRVCEPCVQFVSFKALPGQLTTCEPVTACGVGAEEAVEPTRSSDAECRPCVAGSTFKAGASGTCQPVTACATTEFEDAEPTPISDASCLPLTVCSAAQFEQAAATPTSDRVCAACSGPCPSGKFELSPCSPLEDRQCSDCAVCARDEFIQTPCSGAATTVCSACAVCGAGFFQTAACTADRDTVCAPVTACGPAEFVLVPAAETRDNVCEAVTVCSATEFVAVAATASSNAVCRELTTCAPGQFIATAHSPTSDRVCEPCPAGQPMPSGAAACAAKCPAGHFVPAGRVGACAEFVCPAGECDHDGDSATPCTRAVEGTTFADMFGARMCEAVSDCAAGQQEVVGPTLFADRLCLSCTEQRTFKPLPGSAEPCMLVSACGSDQFETVRPTLTSDRECRNTTVCSGSEFELARPTAVSDRSCVPFVVCAADEFEAAAPTGVSNRVCAPVTACSTTQFEVSPPTESADRECAPVTECTPDEFELRAPNATTDRICARLFTTELFFDTDFDNFFFGDAQQVAAQEANATAELRAALASVAMVDTSLVTSVSWSPGSIVATIRNTQSASTSPTILNSATLIQVNGVNATACPPTAFLATPATSTRGVVCTPYTECNFAVEFETQPPTATSDVVCATLTVCGVNQEETQAPGKRSDRICTQIQAEPAVGSRGGLAASTSGIIAVLVIICIVALVWVVMWQRRKKTKDERENEILMRLSEKVSTLHSDAATSDIRAGNSMLRELSLLRAPGNTIGYSNPMYKNPDGSATVTSGYLDIAPAAAPWMKGAMTRDEAEKFLAQNNGRPGDFVVRDSKTTNNFVLSVLVGRGLYEHHVLSLDKSFNFQMNSLPLQIACTTLLQVIEHLSTTLDGNSVLLNWDPEADTAKTAETMESYGKVVRGADGKMNISAAMPAAFDEDIYGTKPEWQYDEMSRSKAESLLRDNMTPGHFLVRKSAKSPDSFVISMVIDGARFEHHVVSPISGGYKLNSEVLPPRCTSVAEVVDHLMVHHESLSCLLLPPAGYRPLHGTLRSGDISLQPGITNPGYDFATDASNPLNHGYDVAYPGTEGGESVYAAMEDLPERHLVNASYNEFVEEAPVGAAALGPLVDDDTYDNPANLTADVAPVVVAADEALYQNSNAHTYA